MALSFDSRRFHKNQIFHGAMGGCEQPGGAIGLGYRNSFTM